MAAFSLPSWLSRTFGARPAQAWCRTALASETSLQASVEEIASQLRGAGPADLALVFVAASYASGATQSVPQQHFWHSLNLRSARRRPLSLCRGST